MHNLFTTYPYSVKMLVMQEEDEMKVIMMREFGPVLGTRVSGRAAYDRIMSETCSLQIPTTFDFDGVKTVTSSFADEVFGRMALDLGLDSMRQCTSFRNVDPFWARVIRGAINSRDEQRELATA